MYFDDVAADEHRVLLADEIGKVDDGRSRARRAAHGQDLRLIILDVFLDLGQLLNARQGFAEDERLRRRSPIDLRFVVEDDKVEDEHNADGDEGDAPVEREHDGEADDGHEQTQPFVVILRSNFNDSL